MALLPGKLRCMVMRIREIPGERDGMLRAKQEVSACEVATFALLFSFLLRSTTL